jgi:hypothetical protein
MKKLLAISFVAALLPSMVIARGNHPMAGCGLGYMLLSNKDNSKVSQILGATTNGTSGNQTFGITSGTSGCTEDGAVKFAKEAEVFAEINLDSLRREMADGQGEFVTAFASLLGSSSAKVPQLVQFFHNEYTTLFPSAATSSAELMQTLQDKLAQHPELLS